MDDDIYSPPRSNPTTDDQNVKSKRIGGWLTLLALGVFLQPIGLSIELYRLYIPIFKDGTLRAISSPGSGSYIEHADNLLIVEFLVNVGLLLVSIYLLYLLVTKHHLFPKLCIGIMLSELLFQLLDAWAVTLVFPGEPFFGGEGIAYLVAQILVSIIWIPYLLFSKRVKATFINKPSGEKPIYDNRKEPRI